jgi:hypothetical protein
LFASATPAQAQKFNLKEVAMCGLLTPDEIERYTGLMVAAVHGGEEQCTWVLASPVGNQKESVTVRVQRESELPAGMALEDVGLSGAQLSKLGVASELRFKEIDPGVHGVHAVCGFYAFSLELRLDTGDLTRVGLELGKRALRRFNGTEERCFREKMSEDQ